MIANLGFLNAMVVRLNGIQNLDAQDFADLGGGLQRTIIEDNRKGVLEGLDKDGNFASPLKYRQGNGQATPARPLRSAAFGTNRSVFKGLSNKTNQNVLPNNNLRSSVYKKLTGPRLAPRKEASRVIANLVVLPLKQTADSLTVSAAWFDVLSAKGVPFLSYHFDGMGKLPQYDLRGIRPWGMETARKLVRLWAQTLITARKP
jgi:hypothetical protein